MLTWIGYLLIAFVVIRIVGSVWDAVDPPDQEELEFRSFMDM